MSAVPDLAYRWPRERYDHAVEAGVFEDARVELLDGEIVDMSPQSDRTHLCPAGCVTISSAVSTLRGGWSAGTIRSR